MRLTASFAVVATLSAFFACGGESDEKAAPPSVVPHVFVGHVAGTETLVAIVESDEAVVAYTCGKGAQREAHTGWYFGVKEPVVGENLQLVNGPSGLRMRGALGQEGGSGVLTLADSSELAFTVEPARGDAGLFDYEDAATVVGFIRANDGTTDPVRVLTREGYRAP